jgi:hypothetical protein
MELFKYLLILIEQKLNLFYYKNSFISSLNYSLKIHSNILFGLLNPKFLKPKLYLFEQVRSKPPSIIFLIPSVFLIFALVLKSVVMQHKLNFLK